MAFTLDNPMALPIAGGPQRTLSVSNVTNATPAVVTTSTRHNLPYGYTGTVSVQGVIGSTGANVKANLVTVIDATSFSLTGIAAGGAYTSGGTVLIPQGTLFNFGGGENRLIFGTAEVLGGDGADVNFDVYFLDNTLTLGYTPGAVYITRQPATTAANEAAASIVASVTAITNKLFTVTLSAAPASGKDFKIAFIAL